MVRWKMVKSCNYVLCCRFVDLNVESVPKNPSRRHLPFLKKHGVLKMHCTKPKRLPGIVVMELFGATLIRLTRDPVEYEDSAWDHDQILLNWNIYIYICIYIDAYIFISNYTHPWMRSTKGRSMQTIHYIMVWVDFVALKHGSFNTFSWL